ncbi:MAG: thiamine phosphate synthase [Acidobacteria bacterium]|nr:thiamine phosphate synthase [Acidobacteriota bacterium]
MSACLVTDRRRLAGADAPFAETRRAVIAQVRDAAAAGVDLVQVRERDLSSADLAALVVDLLAVTRGSGTRLVVNDRLDVALACGADGVHLRSDSIAPADARRLAPGGFLIGRSVHTADEARRAAGADYLIAGAVFATASKPGATRWLGLDGLRSIVKAAGAPVLAIGGVTVDRLDEIAAAGAAGIAAIGLFQPAGDASRRPSSLEELVSGVHRRFDSLRAAP